MKSITRPASNWENYKNYRRQLFRSFQVFSGPAWPTCTPSSQPFQPSWSLEPWHCEVQFNCKISYQKKNKQIAKKCDICYFYLQKNPICKILRQKCRSCKILRQKLRSCKFITMYVGVAELCMNGFPGSQDWRHATVLTRIGDMPQCWQGRLLPRNQQLAITESRPDIQRTHLYMHRYD